MTHKSFVRKTNEEIFQIFSVLLTDHRRFSIITTESYSTHTNK